MTYTITTESGEVITTESGKAISTDPTTTVKAIDIILLSLKQAGVIGQGQTPAPEDTNDSLTLLNFMISQWSTQRWLVYHLVTTGVTSTGQTSYTVGPGGDFNIPRPDRLESAFFRQIVDSQPNQVDYPLQIIEARETYNRIVLKSLISFPSYIFYDSNFPTGTVYPWPVPTANIYQIFISTKEVLNNFPTITTSVNLPPQYYAAILYNLSVRLRVMYQLPPDTQLNGLARSALAIIRGSNTQIPRLVMPTELMRGGLYNIFSDTNF